MLQLSFWARQSALLSSPLWASIPYYNIEPGLLLRILLVPRSKHSPSRL